MTIRSWLAAATVGLLAAGALGAAPAGAADAPYKVLVFSKTAGFRHSSVPNGIAAIQALGSADNFTVTATEDANAFTTANLAQYQAVVFMSTGALLGTLTLSNTGGWDTLREAALPLATNCATSVFLVFHGGSGSLFDIDEFSLIG
jgi:hypothetical protein